MLKILLTFLAVLPIKEEIAHHQAQLEKRECAESHYRLATAYYHDQEVDKAFIHFLAALKLLPKKASPALSAKEKEVYDSALADYLAGGGSDPQKLAQEMITRYEGQAAAHPDWIHLRFLIATAYANLNRYDIFFTRFFEGYPFLSETFLAYKTRGILSLRLSQHGSLAEERHAYREEAYRLLTKALDRNPEDSGLYKVLIFLAKDEKNDALVLNYLQKIVEHEAPIPRSDIYLYVREAVALGEPDLGQQIIDLARAQYDFSRAISAAQEYLNQCRG